jgi:predicted enzyme related to lactoylglutathione lyase
MTYVRVANLDTCLEAVKAGGGQVVIGPLPVPETGRFAVILDPQGAAVSPIELSDPKDMPADGTPGSFCWDELHSKDPAQSKAFYSAAFGWEWDEKDMGPMGTYHTVRGGENGWAGCMQLPPEIQAPAAWMPYVSVEDVDATHAKATELGASTYVPPSDIPGIGRFAVIADPVGAAIAVYTMAAQPA